MSRTAVELAVVALVLTVIAGLVYGPQAIHGGFISDAWTNRAIYLFSEAGDFFGRIAELGEKSNIAPRPLQAVYLVVLNSVFGSHVDLWLIWQVATTVGMCVAFYLLLRRLSFSALDAGAMAVLLLIFPAASSTRFWLATIWAPAALAMVCLGFLFALYAFDAKTTRSRLALHAASLAMFVCSLLLYEIALLVMLSSVLVYLLRAPWRAAVIRWGVDCVVLITVTLTVTLGSDDGHLKSEVGAWAHGESLLREAVTLGMTVVLPFSSARWYLVLLVLLVPAAALAAWRLRAGGDPLRSSLARWLLTMAAGAVVVVLGYVVYAPGTDYYAALGPGIINRVNVLPSFGWVLMLYAGAMMVATLFLREIPAAQRWISVAAATGCALIAIGWLRSIDEYSDHFISAYGEDVRVLGTMKSALPDPKPNSTIWTFAQPVEVVPGVPVFGNTWDMTSSVQLTYDDPTLTSLPVFPDSPLECRRDRIVPTGRYVDGGAVSPEFTSAYGSTYFINTTSGRVAPIEDREQCLRALPEFPPAPYLPPAAP